MIHLIVLIVVLKTVLYQLKSLKLHSTLHYWQPLKCSRHFNFPGQKVNRFQFPVRVQSRDPLTSTNYFSDTLLPEKKYRPGSGAHFTTHLHKPKIINPFLSGTLCDIFLLFLVQFVNTFSFCVPAALRVLITESVYSEKSAIPYDHHHSDEDMAGDTKRHEREENRPRQQALSLVPIWTHAKLFFGTNN